MKEMKYCEPYKVWVGKCLQNIYEWFQKCWLGLESFLLFLVMFFLTHSTQLLRSLWKDGTTLSSISLFIISCKMWPKNVYEQQPRR